MLLATTLLFTLQLEGGLLLVLLGLLLSHLSTLLLLADAEVVEDQDVAVVDADADAESNDDGGGNAIEAIVVVVVVAAATIFDEEALRTQLSKLDTKVSSAEPTPVVQGDAALYSVAEVICLPMSMGSGDTEADAEADAAAVPGRGLPPMLVTAEELAVVNTCCCCCSCCCCLSLLAG